MSLEINKKSKKMKIALAQINNIIGDIEGNSRKIEELYRRGVKDGADLVVFSELAITGYPPQDLIEKDEFRKAVKDASERIAKITTSETGLIFGSIVERNDPVGTGVYNSALMCHSGRIQFIQNKMLIPNYDVFDEVRYFEPAQKVELYEFKGEKLGISICEDIWNDDDYWKHRRYHRDPVREQIDAGATVLINISASPYSYGRRTERFKMLETLTSKDKIPLAYVCQVGAQSELIFDGGSMCFNSEGKLCLLGRTYREDYFIFDLNKNYEPIEKVEEAFEEEILEALTLGVSDYARKTGFKKAIIGLSGGIDSALVTYIAVKALGKENVRVILMPGEYSSSGSIDDAVKLIKNLGITYNIISIQPVYEKLLDVFEPYFRDYPRDVTEENLQARIRGIYLMAMSNKFGYLLLTTGNKSEMATGYATLYGDMCGALAVIADVYKTQVYKLANFINRKEEIIPREIILKPPSAELSPGQKDEDTLPPYSFLDKILRMYLEEYKEFNEITDRLGNPEIVRKILQIVDKNEFKRKQSAPVLRVTRKAFGYGRRYPIVQKWRRP